MAASSSSISCSFLVLLAAVAAICALPWLPPSAAATAVSGGSAHRHLTAGFTRVRLKESQFVVQKPYDVPLRDRYKESGGVRIMWVFATDKPISNTHPGGARTEIKIFGAATHATTLMLHVYDGKLTYYHDLSRVIADRVYDRWIRLNVVHDVGAGKVTVFVDGERKLNATGQGGTAHYFKFGVYKQSHHQPSHRMESHWKNVAVYTKK
nr:unnamed protein product [Digitaria exilis]